MHVLTDTLMVPGPAFALFKTGIGWTVMTMLLPLPGIEVFSHERARGEFNPGASVSVDRMHMDDFGTLQGGELRGFRPWI